VDVPDNDPSKWERVALLLGETDGERAQAEWRRRLEELSLLRARRWPRAAEAELAQCVASAADAAAPDALATLPERSAAEIAAYWATRGPLLRRKHAALFAAAAAAGPRWSVALRLLTHAARSA